jgi:hypothetical protein
LDVYDLLNTGSGFSQPITFSFPIISWYSLAKMDADNLPDLIVARDDISRVRLGILKNNGNGLFQAPLYTDIQKNQNYSYSPRFVTGDFNQDAKTDVIVVVENVMWLLKGNGDGTFQTPAVLNPIDAIHPLILAGDFDKDNIQDLVINRTKTAPNPYSTVFSLEIMRGKGDGSFLAPQTIYETNIYSLSSSKIYDINLDGNLDIINVIDDKFYTFYGYGNSTFTKPQISSLVLPAYDPELADFNEDNNLDIVTGDIYTVNTALLLSTTPPSVNNLKFATSYTKSIVATPIPLTLKALDTLLRPTPAYTGTVSLEVSGGGIVSQNYTYTYADRGAKVFTYTFPVAGQYIITATDTLNPALVATTTLTVGEPLPEISLSGASVAEGNSGTTSLVFTATLSKVSTQTVTAQYATSNGTAAAGTDYLSASGTITFSPGITSQLITVTVQGDTNFEPDETFNLMLNNPQNVTIVISTATGTILNDDVPCNPFLVTTGVDNSTCGSLRFAITSANTYTGGVTISVAPTVTEITLNSVLPAIGNSSQPITLTAPCTVQNGRGVPGVWLRGSSNITTGLQLGSEVSVEGFKVTGFSEYAVRINGSSNMLDCMWLGTADGTTATPNGGGVLIEGSNNTLGSSSNSAHGNIISGNNGVGLLVKMGATNNLMNNVLIGYAINGQKLPNTNRALVVENGGSLKIRENTRIAV